VAAEIERYIEHGVPAGLARRVGTLVSAYSLFDITEVAELAEREVGLDTERSPLETAELYYALADHLDIDQLLTSISGLERGNRWHALARLALRDDVYSSLRAITLDALQHSDPGQTAEQKIENWEKANSSRLGRARVALDELKQAAGRLDLATLSVAARQIRSMIR
jgi:glutamate dehydrogenase